MLLKGMLLHMKNSLKCDVLKDNTELPSRGPCFLLKNMNFWQAVEKGRLAVCTTGQAGSLHNRACRWAAHWGGP